MTQVIATDQPVYFAAKTTDVVVTGLVEVTGAVATKLTLVSNTDPNSFLGQVGTVTAYSPLPAIGEWCEAEKMYSYNGSLVICRQSHFRTIYPPEQTPALFIFYQAGAGVLNWIVGEKVEIGAHRLYNGTEYICLQAHVTQSDWTPPATPTLWRLYVPPSSNWAVGVAYKVGDTVMYNSVKYRCLQAHTSQADWTPPATLNVLWALA